MKTNKRRVWITYCIIGVYVIVGLLYFGAKIVSTKSTPVPKTETKNPTIAVEESKKYNNFAVSGYVSSHIVKPTQQR